MTVKKTALNYLTEAQVSLNAEGITKDVAAFCREFFKGLVYTESETEFVWQLTNRKGGYYFRVLVTPESVEIDWDVSRASEWKELGSECSMLFQEHTSQSILNRIESEFQLMASKCFVIEPELKPAAN
jgi:G:T/U-mismatch repair DNA glycosylase